LLSVKAAYVCILLWNYSLFSETGG